MNIKRRHDCSIVFNAEGQVSVPHDAEDYRTEVFLSATPCNLVEQGAFVEYLSTGIRRITTFRSTTDRTYDGGPIRLYYNTTMLQLPTVFSTVTCCTGL